MSFSPSLEENADVEHQQSSSSSYSSAQHQYQQLSLSSTGPTLSQSPLNSSKPLSVSIERIYHIDSIADAVASITDADGSEILIPIEVVTVRGWKSVVKKGTFSIGDCGLFIPNDSIIPSSLIPAIPWSDCARKRLSLDGNRVIKVEAVSLHLEKRHLITEGLLLKLDLVPSLLAASPAAEYHDEKYWNSSHMVSPLREGQDLTTALGITSKRHFEINPELAASFSHGPSTLHKPTPNNFFFRDYGMIEHWKNAPLAFRDAEPVVVLERVRGAPFRCGYVPTQTHGFLEQIRMMMGCLPEFQFVYGSLTMQLQRFDPDPEGQENTFAKMVVAYDLKKRLLHGEVIYGEIIGREIQPGASYGYEIRGDVDELIVYDVRVKGKLLPWDAVQSWCLERGLISAPELWRGPFSPSEMEEIISNSRSQVSKDSTEGVYGLVIRPPFEDGKSHPQYGRRMFQWISNDWLLTHQTE